jgi:hypothetical protein
MKIRNTLIGSTLAVAFMLGSGLTSTASAADKGSGRGGAGDLLLKPITTPAEVEALKPGDEVAMVCSKCKSVVVHRVTTEKGHIKTMTVGEKHACPGCESTIEVTGFGKGKKDQVKHVCQKCGDDSAFCCATKPGAGRKTSGMEK